MTSSTSPGSIRISRCVPGSSPRICYLDNIKIFLIILVVLHHVAVTLGAPGVWYIKEQLTGTFSSAALTLFVSVNQAFFMSLFFLIAGHHSWISLNKHGLWRFVSKRLLRLGIPLMLYDLLVNPAIVVLIVKTRMTPVPEGAILTGIVERFLTIGSGPAWFLERLLVFSLLFAVFMYFFRPAKPRSKIELTAKAFTWPLLLIMVLAGLEFIMKTGLPTTRELAVAGIDFPFFPPRYIAMFLVGIWAARTSAFKKITLSAGLIWLAISFMVTIALYQYVKPLIVDGAASLDFLRILALALWENTLAVGLSIGVLVLFRERLNWTGTLSGKLARSSYAVYLCHAPVLVVMALALPLPGISSLLIFLISAPVALVLSWCLGHLLVESSGRLTLLVNHGDNINGVR